ncbi:hypothetical protein [Microbulbifer aggregans]|uniref:hypothetical protein n=1 Tax=Microbulbifer aggregans TaxID=1769779 RepID=UPI001CFF3DAB|nr:hypothetical protein [Microbulbifer aggregans]
MRQFSILVVFALAFGGAAVLYEQESRKVKGVLTQITDLQAKVGDMQAEINRLNAELEAVKLAERRRPNLGAVANRVLHSKVDTNPSAPVSRPAPQSARKSQEFSVGDVTVSTPAIHGRGESPEESEWAKPTVDAETYESQSGGTDEPVTDPYQ